MREILFRGKCKNSGRWIFGSLVVLDTDSDFYFIVPEHKTPSTMSVAQIVGCSMELVDPETVCQYTGLTDKNGRKIFEGDIIKTSQYGVDDGKGHNFAGFDKFSVEFSDGSFCLKNKWRRYNLRPSRENEVVGSIFDNPELIGDQP